MENAVSMTLLKPNSVSLSGSDALVNRIKLLFDGLRDFEANISRLLCKAENVWVDLRVCGLHSDTVFGVPVSNNFIEYRGFLVYKLKDKKIIQNDILFDWFTMLFQMGIFSKHPKDVDVNEYLASLSKLNTLQPSDF